MKDWLTRRKERRDRQQDFDREALLALLDHVASAAVAVAELTAAKETHGFSEDWESTAAPTFAEHLTQARRYSVLTDDATQAIVDDAVRAIGKAAVARTLQEADEQVSTASEKMLAAMKHIGDQVRKL